MAEHRYVMEKVLGRKLLSSEIVHHIDLNKQNNDASNLIALSRAEHAKIHKTLSKAPNGEGAINLGIQTSTVYWCK